MPINQAIVEGIRNAVFRGESLKQAMMSFYNAGYDREEIEQAAKAFQAGAQPPQSQQTTTQTKQQIQPKLKKQIQQQATKVSSYGQAKEKNKGTFSKFFSKKSKQKQTSESSPKKQISDYKQLKKKSGGLLSSKWFAITLIIVFIILLGVLISLFIFRDQFVAFFNPAY